MTTHNPSTVYTVELWTYDDLGNLAAADATPVVTVHPPDGSSSLPTVTTPSTGYYTAEYTIPDDTPGRYWWEATADVDAEPVYRAGHFQVRDVQAEEEGSAFVDGLASFPAVL